MWCFMQEYVSRVMLSRTSSSPSPVRFPPTSSELGSMLQFFVANPGGNTHHAAWKGTVRSLHTSMFCMVRGCCLTLQHSLREP
jgi:hypothetical protein